MKQKMSKAHSHKAKVKLITRKHVEELASLRNAFWRLLQIDALGGSQEIEELKEAIIDLFFEGGFYICYDPTMAHLVFAPKFRIMAKMQSFYI